MVRQVLGQPDRAALDEAADIFPTDRRQMRTETLLVQFQQPVTMAAFLLGHRLEYPC
jgi:hypothetical protein